MTEDQVLEVLGQPKWSVCAINSVEGSSTSHWGEWQYGPFLSPEGEKTVLSVEFRDERVSERAALDKRTASKRRSRYDFYSLFRRFGHRADR
ncbi:hypothetical protein HQ520_12575 [bacterium]|nr:hypothetical protein [bacterium]